jgi:DNA-binding winged helix-turn-helix (wHTH) protein/TolB-like protein/tetratricopeptide (TPR) repeat protein
MPEGKHFYEFGPFRLDPSERSLLRDGKAVPLTPKAFELLVLLVENPGHLLKKDELIERVWPNTFVEEANLAQNVSALRKALDVKNGGAQYIETVPKGGYRFIGTVNGRVLALPANGSLVGGERHAVPLTTRRTLRTRILIGLGCAALLLMIVRFTAGKWWQNLRGGSDVPAVHSIAVLPFSNASRDPELDYLGEGLSAEITNSLSRLRNLRVMARSTVFHYKLRKDDPQGVGRDLHVDTVLTGSFVEHGSEINVDTELIDVATGAQLWGARYTRSTMDASLLQSAITRDIATKLRPQMGKNERESVAKVGTKDDEAYRFYLKGRYYVDWSAVNLSVAAEFFNKAIARDPNYAAAYAGLADVYSTQGYMGYVSGPEQMDRARSAAHRALELDSQISESHVALANLDFLYFWNFPEAEEEIRRALALDPNSVYALQVSCSIKAGLNPIPENLTDCQKAVELDPLSASSHFNLVCLSNYTRDYDRAIEEANKVLEIDPKYSDAVAQIAFAYQQKGNYKQAMEQWVKIAQLRGHNRHAKDLMHTFETSGYAGYLKQDAREQEAQGYYYWAAADYAMLHESDAAFAALEKAFANRSRLVDLKGDPPFDNIRSDPRFADLLRRIGFPQ